MRGAQRAGRVDFARELLAVGRFSLRRMGITGGEHDFWCVDDWEATAAEVAAELGISRGPPFSTGSGATYQRPPSRVSQGSIP